MEGSRSIHQYSDERRRRKKIAMVVGGGWIE